MIFIVGAPRSGTTSLSTYLKEHADICFSFVKEPHFFSQYDLRSLDTAALRRRVEEDYLQRYFPDRDRGRPVLAEGSVSYLYVPEQMEPILRLWPDAKFVIALRDPMELLPSLHLRLLYNGDETERDFGRAWSLAAERRQGRQVPASCIDPRSLQYENIASLGKHVERFIAAVGRERCFFSVFDDLARDPEAVYRALLEFLELPYQPRADFAPQRASRSYRLGGVQRFLKRPPVITRSVLAGEKFRRRVRRKLDKADPWLVRLILAARKRVVAWNTVAATPSPLSPQLRLEIRAVLRDDVARLSDLLGRSLDHWLAADQPPPHRDVTWSFGPAQQVELPFPLGDRDWQPSPARRRVAAAPLEVPNGY